jgi:glycosyltransferase involved in cell wall biosynthesis
MMAARLRVLHVVPYFPPDRAGGVGEVVAHLHRGLLSAGHDSTVFTAGTSRGEPHVIRIATSPAGFVLNSHRAIGRARESDVVHCHHGDSLALLLAMRLRRVLVPVLTTFHGSSLGLGRAFRPYRIDGRRFGTSWRNRAYRTLSIPVHRLFDRVTLRLSGQVSFVSRSAARDVLGTEHEGSARVVYNAVPDPPKRSGGRPVEPTELLFVGLPRDSKRVNILPSVLRRVRQVLPHARLRLVGFRLEEQAELVGLFDRLKVSEAVICEGAMRSEEIQPFYRAAGVLLLPSAYEGLPMVLLEALGAGLPCVATRVGGIPEVIQDGVNGFVTELDSPEQLAGRSLDILNDPDRRRRMGEAGRRMVVERFGLTRQFDEYLHLYRSLCDARS